MALTLFTMLAKLGLDTSEFSKGLADASKAAASGAGDIVKDLGKIGTVLGAAGLGVAVAGVTAIGAAAITSAAELDSAYDTIAVATGAVGDDLLGLQADFKAVFTAIPTEAGPASEVIAALNTRLGLTGTALQDLATPMLRMTDMLGGDAVKNTELFTRVLGDWGVEVENAPTLLDQFFVASQETGAGVDSLMAKVVQFGSPLRLMGFDLETSIGLFAKWEAEGVNAELVMGSLRIAAGHFAKEGVNLQEGLTSTIDTIKSMTDESAALALGMEVFGARAGPDMVAAIREGRFELGDMEEALRGVDGAILAAAASTDDWPEKLQLLKNQGIVALEPLGMAFMDLASLVLDTVTPYLSGLALWASETMVPAIEALMPHIETLIEGFGLLINGDLEGFLGNVQEALTGLVGPEVADQIMEVVDSIVAFITEAAAFVSDHSEEFKAALIAIGAVLAAAAIAPAITGIVGAIGALANPITLVITAVGLLAAAWAGDWGGIQTKTLEAIEAIKGFIAPFLETVRAWWDDHGAAVLGAVTVLWDGIRAHVDLVINLVRGIIQTVMALIQGDWDLAWQNVQGIADTALAIIQNLVDTVLGAVATLFGQNREEVEGTATGLWATLTGAFETGLAFLQGLIDTVLGTVQGLWEAHGESVTAVLENAWAVIQTVIDTALGVIEGLTTAWTAAREGDWYAFGEALRTAVDTLWEGIKSIFSLAFDSIKIIAETGLSILTTVFSGGWDLLKEAVTGLVGSITSAFTDIDWASTGTAIIDGIKSGVTGAAASLAEAAKSTASGALAAVKGFLGIGSPSKVAARELGMPFTEGIGVGIELGLRDLARDILPDISATLTMAPAPAPALAPAGSQGAQYQYTLYNTFARPDDPRRIEHIISALEAAHG